MSENTAEIILYAEDDENDVFFMERAFSLLALRHRLRVVADGEKVLSYLNTASPGALPYCLLLDLKMPKMSGLEVLAWLRKEPRFATLPTVVFSSSTEKADLDFCRSHHANAFLAKPANAENLSPLIQRVLQALAEVRPKARTDTLLPLEENLLLTPP